MKVVFHLDSKEVIELDPAQLQLRQIAPGQSALGVTVAVADPADGNKQVPAFRPFINYKVNLALPEADQKSIRRAEAKRNRKKNKLEVVK